MDLDPDEERRRQREHEQLMLELDDIINNTPGMIESALATIADVQRGLQAASALPAGSRASGARS